MRTGIRAVVVLSLASSAAPGDVGFTTVALSGDPAPGAGSARFASFGTPVIGEQGDVVFLASLAHSTADGVDAGNDTGVWGTEDGVLYLVAREGDLAPDTPGARFSSFDFPLINASKHVAFLATLRDGVGGVDFTNEDGIWVRRQGTLTLAAREGDDAPGCNGADFDDFTSFDNSSFRFVLTPAGGVAFRARLQSGEHGVTTGNRDAVWGGPGSTMQLLVRAGDPAPGVLGGVFANIDSNNDPFVASSGEVCISGRLIANGTTVISQQNDQGVWRSDGGVLQLVARRGDPAPGTVAGVFQVFGGHSLDRNGNVAFNAPTGVPYATHSATFIDRGEGPVLMAAHNGPVPGVPGAVFGGTTGTYSDASGTIVPNLNIRFPSTGAGGGWTGVISGSSMGTVAYNQGPAPGTSAVFASGGVPTASRVVCMSGTGELAFIGQLNHDQPGATDDDDSGLWATGGQELRLLIREGDDAPGIVGRELGHLWAQSGSDRYPLFNGRGDIVFFAPIRASGSGEGAPTSRALWAADNASTVVRPLVYDGGTVMVRDAAGVQTTRTVSNGIEVMSYAKFTGSCAWDNGMPKGLSETGLVGIAADFTDGSTGILIADLDPAEPCGPADCDSSGLLNIDDVDCFVAAFLASDLDGADCDANGLLNVDDVDCFIAAFLAGCP